jgi:hypothetical protein
MLYFPVSGERPDNLVDWSEPLLIGSQSELARACAHGA